MGSGKLAIAQPQFGVKCQQQGNHCYKAKCGRRLNAFNAYSERTADRVIAHGKGERKTSNGLVTIKAVEIS